MATFVTPLPSSGAGYTPARVKAAATTNATSVKASAGVVGGYALYNNTAAVKCVKFYNKASAPTVGTDVPLFTVIIPASSSVHYPAGMGPTKFSLGIAYAITGLATDVDATATAVDDVHGTVLYA
jgi:hypothetical protein